ncbi:MAG: integrase [Deltaproteobacteria bacterium]|nr:MAG: integrase [Deltaproteobacteria bacterium]
MNGLAKALEEYIVLRRALGFELRHAARTLPGFVAFLEHEGAAFITTKLALQWAQQDPESSSVTRSDRLSMVRRFATWLSASDPRTEIPIALLLPRRYQRPMPYIYSNEEIEALIVAARSLPSAKGLRGFTCATLFGLLAVTGMRIGEAVALNQNDVDLESGVLSIREGKFGKSRFIPIHATTRGALDEYAKKRSVILPVPRTPAFFTSDRGRRLSEWSAGDNFARVSRAIGLRPSRTGRRRGRGPRLHDLRHRFAVSTLINWYQSGADVDRELPKLATYLGHNGPDQVYWYLQAVPELLEIATERSRRRTTGGAS